MPPIDFRASNIQTNKIISSGSTGTGAKLLMYPIDSQDSSNPNQGIINPSAFSSQSIGTDIFLYVSGAIGSKDSGDSHGTSVFGGDLVVSGNFTVLGSGASADVNASYVVMSTTASLPNERALVAGNLISVTDGGAGGGVTIASTLPSNLMSRLPDISASYIVAGLTSSLPNERVLTAGTGLTSTDNGANGTFIISNPSVSSTFITLSTNSSLPNERVLSAGDGIAITDNGAGNTVTISVTSASFLETLFAEISASFITVNATSSLPNERVLTAGVGLTSTDNGANSSFVISNPSVSSTFITLSTNSNLPNERVLAAGDGIYLTDNGAGNTLTINAVSASYFETIFAEISASFITVNATSSLPHERRLVAGVGLDSSDGGSGGNFTISAPFVSSTFITLNNESSLPNERRITAGDGISITDGGAGSTLTISVTSASILDTLYADISASFITVGTTSSLPNERRLLVGAGLSYSDSGANGNFTISAPFVSATFITLNNESSLPNERRITAGDGISIEDTGTTIVVSSTLGLGQFADVSASYIVHTVEPNLPFSRLGSELYGNISASYIIAGATSSLLPNERVLTAGAGIAVVDNGANNTIIVSSSFNVSSAFVMVGGIGNYPGQRALSAGTGISITDNGAGSTVVLNSDIVFANSGSGLNVLSGTNGVNPLNVIFHTISGSGGTSITLSGSTLIVSSSTTSESTNTGGGGGEVSASYVVLSATSSLANERVLTAGNGISITDNGPGNTLILSSTISNNDFADVSASYIVVGLTSSLPNERVLTAGTGIEFQDNGANGTFVISSSVSGTNLGSGTGVLSGSSGNTLLFKSLVAGSNITITPTDSQITISGEANYLIVSPTIISSRQDDYYSSSFDTANVLRLSVSGNQIITGISAANNPREMTLIMITSGANTSLTLAHQSTSSLAGNRFICPGNTNYYMLENDTATIFYDNASLAWRLI